ncbi:hypothetical protein F4678DRAFT_221474 [Xylaria arbuscula]|nr:hypothetical protein F4678DRAFT_221474 [Xylaria arbuscula]
MAQPLPDQHGDAGYHEHSLAKKGKKIEVFVKIMEIDTGIKMDRSKTIGTIATRNSNKILKVAHSGYSVNEHRSDICLDTARWNMLALHFVAKQIGFIFPGNIRDTSGGPVLDEYRGRAHAGHVEVLLACWYVVDLVREEFNYINKTEEDLIKNIKRLRDVALHDKRTAFITIDSQPCRTCLQFLHKLSKYTEVFFQIKDSRGVGPVQVRVGGGRREDVIGETFIDSDNELSMTLEDELPNAEVVENPEVNNDHQPTPITPISKSAPRRPSSSWRPMPWTPENPEQLLSSYKRKTPVYEFPGYDRDGYSTQLNPVADTRVDTTTKAGDLDEWVDVGDDVLMYCTSPKPVGSESTPIKCENRQSSAVSRTQNCAELFAGSAYEAVQESIEDMDYEIVETAENTYRTIKNQRTGRLPHADYMPISRLRNIRGREPTKQRCAHLHKYRHYDIDDSNESVFKSRYSILRPPTGR